MDTIRDLLPTPLLFIEPLHPFMPMWAPEKKGEIAIQLRESDVDYFIGGGKKLFN